MTEIGTVAQQGIISTQVSVSTAAERPAVAEEQQPSPPPPPPPEASRGSVVDTSA